MKAHLSRNFESEIDDNARYEDTKQPADIQLPKQLLFTNNSPEIPYQHYP